MTKQMIVPAGMMFIVSSGKYSGYGLHTLLRAKQEVDLDSLARQYLEEHPDQKEEYHLKEEGLVSYLLLSGLFDEVPCWEYHFSDYGTFEQALYGSISGFLDLEEPLVGGCRPADPEDV